MPVSVVPLCVLIYIHIDICSCLNMYIEFISSDCVSWVNASGGAVPADAWVAWAGDGGGRGQEQVNRRHHYHH